MAMLKGPLLLIAVSFSLVFVASQSYGKGHSGGKSREGKSCSYDRCVDKCVARTGVGNFANARCSQKCVKRGCT